MSLNTTKLKTDLFSLFKEMRTKTEMSDDYYADKFSKIIEDYVKTGAVKVNPGISVVTNTGSGSTTSIGTGIIE